MKVLAIVLLAIRDKIFFCARSPMSRALNEAAWLLPLSIITGIEKSDNELELGPSGTESDKYSQH